jgi:uncharacterized protein YbbC (DUF1343 family)
MTQLGRGSYPRSDLVRCGLDVLLSCSPSQKPLSQLVNRRVGLLCNPTSVNRDLQHIISLFQGLPFELAALFGPEHGIDATAQDMVSVDAANGSRHGMPVYSLYGQDEASLVPRDEWLTDLDVVVVDLQDIGSRYYTYIWTCALMMRACAQNKVAVMVLDRPNPLGGQVVEGPGIDAGYESFVGLWSIPNRHGLTIGELAELLVAEWQLDLELTVVQMQGWRREQLFETTGLPWVMPSPNMPTLQTALVYPGGCLIEGTALSEGRGTTRPFEIVGAPYIDAERLVGQLEKSALPGVRFRPLGFQPTFQKHAQKSCFGVQAHVTNHASFAPLATYVEFLRVIRSVWPEQFAWREQAYEFVQDRPAIDLLAGGPWLRRGIEQGASLAELTADWQPAQAAFLERRRPFLRYD